MSFVCLKISEHSGRHAQVAVGRLARCAVFYGTSRIWRSLSRVQKRTVTGRYLSRISALLVSSLKTFDKLFYSIHILKFH